MTGMAMSVYRFNDRQRGRVHRMHKRQRGGWFIESMTGRKMKGYISIDKLRIDGFMESMTVRERGMVYRIKDRQRWRV